MRRAIAVIVACGYLSTALFSSAHAGVVIVGPEGKATLNELKTALEKHVEQTITRIRYVWDTINGWMEKRIGFSFNTILRLFLRILTAIVEFVKDMIHRVLVPFLPRRTP